MNISEIVKWFDTGYFGSALGVIGILAGLITFYVSRKKKILAYGYKRTLVMRNFKNEMNGLEVKYNNHLLKNLSSTNIGIWNEGRDAIKRDDIAPKDPITIHFTEEIIGEPELIFVKTPSNQISLNKHGNKIILDFDFLDFGDGATIQVFHTSKLILDPINMDELNQAMNTTSIFDLKDKLFHITGKVIGSQEKIKLFSTEDSFLLPYFKVAICLLISLVGGEILKLTTGKEFFEADSAESKALVIILAFGSVVLGMVLGRRHSLKLRMNPRVIDKI